MEEQPIYAYLLKEDRNLKEIRINCYSNYFNNIF